MAIDLKSISKNVAKPPRIAIYGPPGIGKTTFAAGAPNPVFILTEDGLGDLEYHTSRYAPRLRKSSNA
jgi:ABC-type iron transport system FetAB ATPase subunit